MDRGPGDDSRRSPLQKLKARRIGQWAFAYLGGAWLLLQVLDVLANTFPVPLGIRQGLIVALLFGLAITLVLAWYHGESGRQRVTGAELAIIGTLAVLAGTAIYAIRGRLPAALDEVAEPGAASTESLGPSVAVLPFTDLSPERDHEYFADGIADELISALGGIEGLRVTARTSAFAFKDSALSVPDVARRLGVGTIVEGSVRKGADILRITARLVDVDGGFELWSNRFDRSPEDVFAVQEEIAEEVATALRIQMTDGSAPIAALGQTSNPEAQDLYLRGRFEWHRRTQDGLELAVDLIGEAIDLDPTYARALVGLADAYAVLGFYDYRPPSQAFPMAQEAARAALAIEPRLAEAHATLGYAALYHDRDWEEAEAEFELAVEMAPTYPIAHQWFANYFAAMGRFDEAEASMRRASELDPLSTVAHAAVGWVLVQAREYERAIDQLEETIARDPMFELAYLWSGQAHDELGRFEEAARLIQRTIDLSGGSRISRAALARVRARQGLEDEAREILRSLEEGEGYVPSYEVARAFAGLGDADEAVRWLTRAAEERAHSVVFLAVDPAWEPLGGNPAFERLLADLDFPTG